MTFSNHRDALNQNSHRDEELKGEMKWEISQDWTCSLWTCPDIKQAWNLTHTSYIDRHSRAVCTDGPGLLFAWKSKNWKYFYSQIL